MTRDAKLELTASVCQGVDGNQAAILEGIAKTVAYAALEGHVKYLGELRVSWIGAGASLAVSVSSGYPAGGFQAIYRVEPLGIGPAPAN